MMIVLLVLWVRTRVKRFLRVFSTEKTKRCLKKRVTQSLSYEGFFRAVAHWDQLFSSRAD